MSIHASAWPPNRVPMWLVWLGKTISAMRTSVGGTTSGVAVMAVGRAVGSTRMIRQRPQTKSPGSAGAFWVRVERLDQNDMSKDTSPFTPTW
ncbi:hypothetical protein D9M72_650700 [compost metagenome]